MMVSRFVLIALVVLGATNSAHGQTDVTIPYAGSIAATDANVGTSTANIIVRMFSRAIPEEGGGTVIPAWEESHEDIAIDAAGRFNLDLGAGTLLNDSPPLAEVLDGSRLFIEFDVDILDGAGMVANSLGRLFPRQQLLYTPYAVFAVRATTAKQADMFDGQPTLTRYPTGAVLAYGGELPNGAPAGWALCNGQALSRTDPKFAGLFALIGTTYNRSGTPSSQFNVPNYQGLFLRGANRNRSDKWRDPERANPALGATQAPELVPHRHPAVQDATNPNQGPLDPNNPNDELLLKLDSDNSVDGDDEDDPFDLPGNPNLGSSRPMTDQGGVDTHPQNAYVHFIIKL